MEIIPPASVPLMPHEVPAVTPVSREERQHDLLLHQMIRATVEEEGQEKALLNFGERKLWVETGTPLRTGDTVNLQVVENDNRLGFRLIPPNLLERLGQSLHLLDKQLDPMALLPALIEGREPGSTNLDQKTRDGLDRLFSLLRRAPAELDGQALREIPQRLGLGHEAQLGAGQTEAARETLKNALGRLQQGHTQLRQSLSEHLEPLFAALRTLPEELATPPSTTTRPTGEAPALAALLRPLLRLAQSQPEAPASPQTSFTTSETHPDAARTAALAREFFQALGNYLRPFSGQTAAPLHRLEEAARALAAPPGEPEAPVLREAAQQFWNRLSAAPANAPAAPEIEQTLTRLAEQLLHPAQAMDGKFLRNLPRQLGLPTEGRENAALADRLDRLAQGLGRLPEALRTPEQIGAFLDRQPADLAAVLRPLFRFAASGPTTTSATSLPATAGTAPAANMPILPPSEVAVTTQAFVTALRDYLRPFAEVTEMPLARIEQQLALLPQMPPFPFDQALAALGQKATGKDLLGALFHLLRSTPERLVEGSAENLTRQLIETLGKTLYQELDRGEQRQEENLRHLELWQLCRSRLGESDGTFVPLPLPFLENGYLVARRRESPEEGNAPGGRETFTLSLFLDLRKLGFVQIDLLYQQQELFVRFHCQDTEAAQAFSAAREELGDSLGGIPLATVAVGVGAESPDRALIREIIPAERSLLDARA
ncbi:hypothetical protein [Trichloromonas sp.]|uniref:hypothetical protein n=1 Tax=Trichloromonas sp. TaxID=3069249 RepID=UPI002A37431B|nr:flagellar hook-length control protein FliK [Trichloromonas sp.]